MVWIRGDSLSMWTDDWSGNIAPAKVLDEDATYLQSYQLVQAADGTLGLVWSSVSDGPSDLRYAIYDDAAGEWSEPQGLTGDESVDSRTAVLFGNDGTLQVAYVKTAVVLEDRMLAATTGGVVQYEDIPAFGLSDLYTLNHKTFLDLALTADDIALAASDAGAGPQPGRPARGGRDRTQCRR